MWALYRFESNWKVTKPKLKCTLHILTNAFDSPLKLQLTLLKHLEKRTTYIKNSPLVTDSLCISSHIKHGKECKQTQQPTNSSREVKSPIEAPCVRAIRFFTISAVLDLKRVT